ncbi:helix-turn-helix domain-containing protein [Amorphus sp. 3PC139-8]|uniref:helix-turn-helix domain-containing protein n=1 Tax=Amorphus sp. 3PC139-8 TaxID=2735676 RepID=UPI00345C6308
MTTETGIVAIRPGDTFEHWHQVTCRDFSRTGCSRAPKGRFSAHIAIRDFGPLAINSIASDTSDEDDIHVVREESDIGRDPRDYFMLWLSLGGNTAFSQNGREVLLEPGDLVLHDQAQTFAIRFRGRSQSLMVSIPRSLLSDRLPDAAARTAVRLPQSTRLGSLAGSIMRQIAEPGDPIDSEVSSRISASILDVFGTAIQSVTSSGVSARRDEQRLEAVKRYMAARADDPGLSLASISAANNMSERTLCRLFAEDGTTVMRWLWDQRLQHAHRMLAAGRCRSVTEAAFAAGFSDLSHFSKAFRAKYGCTPKSHRDRCS